MRRAFNVLLPFALGFALLALWQWIVVARHIPPYVLPAPSAIAHALSDNFSSLMLSLLSTLTVTLEGFIAAWISGWRRRAGAICFSAPGPARRTPWQSGPCQYTRNGRPG